MIRFVCGRSGSGKSEYIMDAVRKAGASGKKIILIVPEQQAVAWQLCLASHLGIWAAVGHLAQIQVAAIG